MSTWHKIIIGDSRHIREVQLKDYGDEKQIRHLSMRILLRMVWLMWMWRRITNTNPIS
jgi:hypothetical protein